MWLSSNNITLDLIRITVRGNNFYFKKNLIEQELSLSRIQNRIWLSNLYRPLSRVTGAYCVKVVNTILGN